MPIGHAHGQGPGSGPSSPLGCADVTTRVLLAVLVGVAVLGFARHAGDSPPLTSGNVFVLHDDAAVKTSRTEVAPPLRRTADGFLIIDQGGRPSGTGAPVTYSVEVEPTLRRHASDLQRTVATALTDERRGWASATALRQVGDPESARIRILLATPATVDSLCAAAGYYTGGQYSCWNGRFAALNLMRWRQAAAGFDSVAQYRTYQVNHEFGHGLGYGHEYCPGTGATAPVMMQQTKGLLGCQPNPWPNP